jgi:AraC-like DNA-binding protein
MEYIFVGMDDSSISDLFHRSLTTFLETVAGGGLIFVPPNPHSRADDLDDPRCIYPPESHLSIEAICCVKNRMTFLINDTTHTLSGGEVIVALPGDKHTERPFRMNLMYQLFWVQVLDEFVGIQLSCYHPAQGYYLLGRRVELLVESRVRLLQIANDPLTHTDRLLQIRFQTTLMDILLECLPLVRHLPDTRRYHAPATHYLLDRIKHYIDTHLDGPLSPAALAKAFHYSPSHLNLLFRQRFGTPILKYIQTRRIDQATHLLQTTDLSIKQIAYRVGFTDPLYFSRTFRRLKHHAPSDSR